MYVGIRVSDSQTSFCMYVISAFLSRLYEDNCIYGYCTMYVEYNMYI